MHAICAKALPERSTWETECPLGVTSTHHAIYVRFGPKGMAEVNMIPVAPALLNAIYDATGHRFRALPVTQEMIKGVLT